MPVSNKRDDRGFKQLAQLPQRGRKYRCCAAERVSRLRIDHGDVTILDDLPQLSNQHRIIGEFSLADTADLPQQLLPPDKAIDGDHIISAVWEGCDSRHFEIQKSIVIA